MRDYRNILTSKMKQEFLDRFSDLLEADSRAPLGATPALESLGAGSTRFSVDDARDAVESAGPGEIPRALEAIIVRFGRPAYFVRNNTFETENTPSSSEEIDNVVNEAKAKIDVAIPSVGRINLRDHRKPWVGTGWLVAPNVVVTNRHVAREFAEREGSAFVFEQSADGRVAKAFLDTVREHQSAAESVYRMRKVLWIEPQGPGHHDVAFLEVDAEGEEDQPQPQVIDLMTDQEFGQVGPEHWLAIIGYPAFSIHNDRDDQQRIFQGVFDVKRLQPGQVSNHSAGQLHHDATTLGGNSGSVVLDVDTGRAMALHFGGIEGDTNNAVTAPVLRQLLRDRVAGV